MAEDTINNYLSGMDTLFLKIEHPRRLMVVSSLWVFSHRLDSNSIYATLDKMCKEYPRFAKIPKNMGVCRPASWVNVKQWIAKDNVIVHTLEEPTEDALQKYCAQQGATPFDYSQPLWELHVISGLENDRCALFWKAHHCLADGEGFVRALLSTTSLNSTLNNTKKSVVVHHTKKKIPGIESKIPAPLWKLLPSSVACVLSYVWKVVWVGSLYLYILCHELFCCFILCIPFITRKDFYYDGLQSYEKEMAWSTDINMQDIKTVRKVFGGSLNDVMLTVIVRCIKRYLEEQSTRNDDYLKLLIPISERSADNWSFCNLVSGTWGFFSMKDLNTEQLMRQVTNEMTAIKSSWIPAIMYNYLNFIFGGFPGIYCPMSLYCHITDIAHGVFTNVPGPTTPITFAGEEIREYRSFPPQVGKGTLGIALMSYNGKVSIGAITDKHRKYPKLAKGLCSRFSNEFNFILQEAKMELFRKNTAL
ncbi:wax ester synthase-like acyl-CoA acyltransferase domain-containing protein [Pilobolus umbonatus]|nr:wax ester synthase-like acyl-CoA acyltransferase domain-containing protein [Pilobolus umbonatus]